MKLGGIHGSISYRDHKRGNGQPHRFYEALVTEITKEEMDSLTDSMIKEINHCSYVPELRGLKTCGIIARYKDMLDEEHMDRVRKAFNEKCDSVPDGKLVKYPPTINDIMNVYELDRKKLSEKFGIPYRTIQNWSLGTRECPDYIIKMIDTILSNNL